MPPEPGTCVSMNQSTPNASDLPHTLLLSLGNCISAHLHPSLRTASSRHETRPQLPKCSRIILFSWLEPSTETSHHCMCDSITHILKRSFDLTCLQSLYCSSDILRNPFINLFKCFRLQMYSHLLPAPFYTKLTLKI